MPERIQMTRQKPWRAEHPDAVIVARGPKRKWGNPFKITHERCRMMDDGGLCWVVSREGRRSEQHAESASEARRIAVDEFSTLLRAGLLDYTVDDVRQDLQGRDLACWCPLDQPCHADVLLAFANRGGMS